MSDPSIASCNDTIAIAPVASTTKGSVRRSLQASTVDGGLAAVFSNITGGILLSNFLLDLGATSVEIGTIASLPMLTNLLQPLGALLSNRTNSRHKYGIWMFLPSRLAWLLLLVGIIFVEQHPDISHQLVYLTLSLLFFSNLLAALGSASWMSWLAALVPPRVRGRYYSIRNIVSNLANLLCLPVASFIVANWQGSELAGYGVVLSIGIVAGLISLGCQHFMLDIDPQVYIVGAASPAENREEHESLWAGSVAALKDPNLVMFLIYFALWGFAVNLSTPFFNLYMLDNLNIDITWVTLFSSIYTGANMLLMLVWGRLSDRFGNRPILLGTGIAVGTLPLFWLLTGLESVQSQLWLYLAVFHAIFGGLWSAIDLCNNNLQIAITPIQHHATFFAIAAATAGVSGALGTTVGGLLAQADCYTGIFGVFSLSAMLRLIALIPLVFVDERRAVSGGLAKLVVVGDRSAAGERKPTA
jgi:MFS family permease